MDLMIEKNEPSLDKTSQSESASADQCCPLVAELTLQLKTKTCWLFVELQPVQTYTSEVMNVRNYGKIFCIVAVTFVSLCRYSDLGIIAVLIFFSHQYLSLKFDGKQIYTVDTVGPYNHKY